MLDVELEAKELLTRFLPAGRAAVEEAYRGMRAELGRRPTPTELLHAHYLPHTLRAAQVVLVTKTLSVETKTS